MAAANSSVNPLSLMGDSDIVLDVIGHTADEEKRTMSIQSKRNITHLDGHGVHREEKFKKQAKDLKFVQRIFLLIIIGIAAAIIAVPLIPFYTRSREKNFDVDIDTNRTDCSSKNYSGTVCLAELQQWHYCGENNGPDILIPSDIDQDIVGIKAEQLFILIQILNPSKDCLKAFRSFICLHLFGVCDGNGHIVQPSYEDCIQLTTDTCVQEVQDINRLFGPEYLPQCVDFSHDRILCRKHLATVKSNSQNETESAASGEEMLSTACSGEFFFDNNSQLCKPECGVWTHFSPSKGKVLGGFRLFATSLGVFSSVLVLGLSCIQYKTMFKFPTIFIVYRAIAVLVYSVFHFISWVWRKELLCSSRDLITSLETRNATIMCRLLGGISIYCLGQVEMWWLFHIVVIMCGVLWPFQYNYYKEKYCKYIHAGILLLGLVIPAIPALAANWEDGYGLSFLSHYVCTVREEKLTFYGLLLPADLMLIAGVIMLIVILWNITVQRYLQLKSSTKRGASPAQIKVLIIICFYLLVALYTVSVSVVTLNETDSFIAEVTSYYLCEANGVRSCSRKGFDQFDSGSKVFAHVVLGAYPLIFLVYIVQLKVCMAKVKKYVMKCCQPQTLTSCIQRCITCCTEIPHAQNIERDV